MVKIISEFLDQCVGLVMRLKCSYCHSTGCYSLFFLDVDLLYCIVLGYSVVLVINLGETCVLPKELFTFDLSDCVCGHLSGSFFLPFIQTVTKSPSF